MKRAAIYVRVSTEEQKRHGMSVNSQILALEKYCNDNNYSIAGIYNDAGYSARKKYTNRPQLLKLMEDCKDGKIDIILFTKLDRWFRSVSDYYQVQNILDDCKVPWRAIWEDYETETSSGVFKVNIMLSVAQSEADRTSERIKAVNEYRRIKGEYVGSAPTGYKIVNKHLIKDEEKKEGVDAFFREYLSSFSITKALHEAAKYGVFFERNHISRLIKNTVFCGLAANGYKCEPYISVEDHKLIIDKMKNNTVDITKTNEVYIFSGLLKCGYCGKTLVAKSNKRKRKDGFKRYTQYLCSSNGGTRTVHKPVYIYETTIENYLLTELDTIIGVSISNSETASNDDARKKSLSYRNNLQAKLKRIMLLYEEGDIDIIQYRKRRDEINAEINQLYMPPENVPLPLPENWQTVYRELSPEFKRAFWNKTIKSITITREERLNFQIEFR